jgi:5-(carboxyamino)imidazole ribonucleotide synthase
MISPDRASPLLPGGVIGVLGGGQLGRMFALAARPLGYKVHVYSAETDPPAGEVADLEVVAAYQDLDRLRDFTRGVQVVTFEFENVPAASTSVVAELAPVRPSGAILHITQNRLREKRFLAAHGFPVTPFRSINSLRDLILVADEIGTPGVLKTANFGYDGKGQIKVESSSELDSAWQMMNGAESIYEAFVPFEKELSVVAARGFHGELAVFPVFENLHSEHILDVTMAPARIRGGVAKQAVELASGILEKLEVIGVLTVELFLSSKGELLVNELAPRTHNSGHLTIDACVTSQFEQQVRAVCGLPLGSTELVRPAAMANLLGELWTWAEPDWASALQDPQVKLHLYGKSEPRQGRKMGHLTVTAPTVSEARERVLKARERLGQRF